MQTGYSLLSWVAVAGSTIACVVVMSATPARAAAAESFLIVNARVVDGTGAPARAAHVRVAGDRILAVGKLRRLAGEEVLDARGLVLAPGFIDSHSHHDESLSEQRAALPVVSQGITTIVVGQDGSSEASLAQFFSGFESRPAAVNIASYTGHGRIRAAVMGDDYKRRATPREIAAMKSLIRTDMQAGALGLSTGLEYDPGIYSSPSEILELAAETARLGGRYITHIRSEDRKVWDAIDEAIEIGRATKMPVQISHAKLAMIDWWGQAPRFIAKLEAARRDGINISADIYPYEDWHSTLTVLFPERDFKNRETAEFALKSLAPAEGLRLTMYKPEPSLVGKTVAEIANARGQDPATTLMDLIAAAPNPGEDESVMGTSMSPQDIAVLMKWRGTNICSDGTLDGGHPRGAGAFTRVLRKYVREDELLSLEEAVHKMTGLTASHMGIEDRGVIRPGAYADLVLFDPATIADRSTVQNPKALSVGIDRVWVNGRLVYQNGTETGSWPGKVIRRRK